MKTKRRKRLHLYLLNDDENTFEHVTSTLMNSCDHNYFQACQCAHLVHTTGRAEVKSGFVPEIFAIYLQLTLFGLNVELRKRKL